MTATRLGQPHHDGSELYADQPPYQLGRHIKVRLRVPVGYGARDVWIRSLRDFEPERIPTVLVDDDGVDRWYEGVIELHNPTTSYRFMINKPGGYEWVTGRGVFERDVTDAGDFRLTTAPIPPAWVADAVVYQIFPDRFARSAAAGERPTPEWAVPVDWDTDPEGRSPLTPIQFFGGDLTGIEEHLDYCQELGVNTIYLTPFFPSRSNHRYDATTFDVVDPLLGGDEALASLTATVHARGMRVIGDLTTNHTGSGHEWFRRAQADPNCVERSFYYWESHAGQEYVSWLGVKTLPKLNFGSPELWRRTVDGPDSAIARWMQPPFNLDGWRIDVANMTGRYKTDDFHHEIARRTAATIRSINPDGMLVSENFHDAAADTGGDGWISNMNYSAFTRPLWAWIAEPDCPLDFLGLATTVPRRSAKLMVDAMTEFESTYPWPTAVQLWNMLGSHDTPRIRTITGDPAVVEVAAALLFAFPGTPAFFMGDEGGFTGWVGEAGRRTMPWDQIAAGGGERWDGRTFAAYQGLIAARKASRALRVGGMRWAFVDDDAVGFLRETRDERVLVVLARAPWSGATLPAYLAPNGEATALYGPQIAALAEFAHDGGGLRLSSNGPGIGIWRLS